MKPHLINFFEFSSSHPNAKSVIGSSKALWDFFFTKYEWVDVARQRNQTPVLMLVNGKTPYLYLYLAQRKDKKWQIDSVLKADQNMALLTEIKASLRPSRCAKGSFEMKFENYTLDISNVLLLGNYHCPALFQMSSDQNVVMAAYGEELKDVKPEMCKDFLGVIKLGGYAPSFFFNDTVENAYGSLIKDVYNVKR